MYLGDYWNFERSLETFVTKFSKTSDNQLFVNPFHGKFYCHQSRNWPTHVKKLFHCSTWSAWKWLKRVISWLIITMYSWWIHTSRLRSRINYFWDIWYLLFLVKMKNMDKCWIEKAFKYWSLSRDERMLRWSRYMQSSQLNMNLSECLYDARRCFMSHQRLWEVSEDPSIVVSKRFFLVEQHRCQLSRDTHSWLTTYHLNLNWFISLSISSV